MLFLNFDLFSSTKSPRRRKFKLGRELREFRRKITNKIKNFLKSGIQDQIRRVAFLCFIVVILLLFLGAIVFKIYDRDLSLLSTLKTALILLNGG